MCFLLVFAALLGLLVWGLIEADSTVVCSHVCPGCWLFQYV